MLSIEKQQQDRQVNLNGTWWEKDIKNRLREYYRQYSEPPTLLAEPYFVHQCKGMFQTIFDEPMILDFYVYHPWKQREGLIIECKYQETSGSVDEKFPFTIANLKATGKPAMLMLMGGGAKKGAVQWCLRQQDDQLRVLTSWDEWIRLFTSGLL